MTTRRVRSNLAMAGIAGCMMALGAWMITNAPNDAFAGLGLGVAIGGVALSTILAWRVGQ